MAVYPVAELFVSINGEGPASGCLSAFIRLKGCNLSCVYCDTVWANRKDCPCDMMSEEDILAWLKAQKVERVTLTGGEPLICPSVDILIRRITESGYKLEIETNGSVDIRPFALVSPRPAFTLDYKCPASGMEDFMITDHYESLLPCDSVKFVISNDIDLEAAYRITRLFDLDRKATVFLSPVFGKIEAESIVDFMKEKQWNKARLQLQLHKYIWPPDARSV